MLFKRKIDVTEYCEGNVKALLSPDREAAYEALRKQCDDPSLTAVDQKLYFDHLRAVVIQLLQIAITKNSSMEVSGDAHFFVAKYLKDRGLSHVGALAGDSLSAIYNRAFGASYQDGVAGMATAFSEQLTNSQMRADTMQRFYLEFYGILQALSNDFKSLKLTTKRR